MAAKRTKLTDSPPAETLEALSQDALRIAKMARLQRKGLAGDNFYGNRLAELRADAANAFRELATQSAGDTTALAELIQSIFSTDITANDRFTAYRELSFALRTTWKQQPATQAADENASVFPLTILTEANRGYLISVGRQMNGCFARGWYDACAVMMRRLLEISIIEAFEHKGIDSKIRDSKGDYLQLSDLVSRALAEQAISLSRNAKKMLPQLRDVGHLSAHGRTFHARKEDIERIRFDCRVVIEEFLTHAGLL